MGARNTRRRHGAAAAAPIRRPANAAPRRAGLCTHATHGPKTLCRPSAALKTTCSRSVGRDVLGVREKGLLGSAQTLSKAGTNRPDHQIHDPSNS